MTQEREQARQGRLIRPYEPFHNSPLAIGTVCEVVSEEPETDTYVVKFPGVIGYSGTFRIRRIYVRLEETND